MENGLLDTLEGGGTIDHDAIYTLTRAQQIAIDSTHNTGVSLSLYDLKGWAREEGGRLKREGIYIHIS